MHSLRYVFTGKANLGFDGGIALFLSLCSFSPFERKLLAPFSFCFLFFRVCFFKFVIYMFSCLWSCSQIHMLAMSGIRSRWNCQTKLC